MVRNHDSLQEKPNISVLRPRSYDADSVDDDDDEAAAYTIAHVNTSTRKAGPMIPSSSNCCGTKQQGGGTERWSKEVHGRQQQPLPSEIPIKQPHNSNRYNTNFTAWKRKKDSKIVGLKHYGLESPRHQLHNTLSDLDDHNSSSNSKCQTTNQQVTQPKRSMFSWWMRDQHHQQSPYRTNTNNATVTTPTNYNSTSNTKRNRLFAVEKEEEMVRNNVTKNPFVLFYLGNLAAIKVLIYYFSKFNIFHRNITIVSLLLCSSPSDVVIVLNFWLLFHNISLN